MQTAVPPFVHIIAPLEQSIGLPLDDDIPDDPPEEEIIPDDDPPLLEDPPEEVPPPLLDDGDTHAGDWNKQLPTPLMGQHVIFPEVHPLIYVPVGQLAIRPEVQQPLEDEPPEDEEGTQLNVNKTREPFALQH